MADDKNPFDDDLMAPPADDEILELDDSGLGVEELTEVDETQSNVVDSTDFGDIDLEAPVEDLPTFDPASAPRTSTTAKAPVPPAAAPQPDVLFEGTDLDASGEVEQQSFGFEEPQASVAELSAAGEDSLSQTTRPGPGKNNKLLLAVVGIAGVALIGGLAVFMLSGNEAPQAMAPVAYEAEAPAPAVTEPVPAPEVAPAPEPVAVAPEPAVAEPAPTPEPMPAPKAVAKPEPKAASKPAAKPAEKPKSSTVVASGEVATQLLSVDVSTVNGKDVVRFEFNGAAPVKIGSFALKATPAGESARYVVDFFGVASGSTRGAGTGQYVTGIRSGKHEGKFRAVLDLTTDSVVAKRRVDGHAVIVELR